MHKLGLSENNAIIQSSLNHRADGETTRDRIFIAPVVKQLDALKRWPDATTLFEGGGEVIVFALSVGVQLDEIRDAAIKDIGV